MAKFTSKDIVKTKDKIKVINTPPRPKFPNMTDSEFDAIVDDIDYPLPLHLDLLKSLRWPTESLRKRILRREVKNSIMTFIDKEMDKLDRNKKR